MSTEVVTFVVLDNEHTEDYLKLHQAMENSAMHHLGLVPKLYKVGQMGTSGSFRSALLEKIRTYKNHLQSSKADHIIFADVDMLFVHDVLPLFNQGLGIGITKQDYRLDTGVLFVDNNPYSHQFFDEWLRVSELMYQDIDFYREWEQVYGEGDKASLGFVLRGFEDIVTLLLFNSPVEKKFIHYRDVLREYLLARLNGNQKEPIQFDSLNPVEQNIIRNLVSVWFQYYND